MARRSAEEAPASAPSCTFDEAVRDIAAAVKVFTEAGLGSACAGELAFKVWCAHNDVSCPPAAPAAE